jgi:small subunit ribosomal protein S2
MLNDSFPVLFDLKKINFSKLVSFGFFFGKKGSSVNSLLQGSILFYNARSKVPVFNINLVLLHLKRSLYFLCGVSRNFGSVLFVSSHVLRFERLLRKVAFSLGQHFVTFRWIGGFLTNFVQIRRWVKRVYKFDKKTILRFKYLLTLKRSFDGVKLMSHFPSVLIAFNPSKNFWAIKEAASLTIPTVGLIASSDTVSGITYPLLVNNFLFSNLKLYLLLFKESILYGRYLFYLENFSK